MSAATWDLLRDTRVGGNNHCHTKLGKVKGESIPNGAIAWDLSVCGRRRTAECKDWCHLDATATGRGALLYLSERLGKNARGVLSLDDGSRMGEHLVPQAVCQLGRGGLHDVRRRWRHPRHQRQPPCQARQLHQLPVTSVRLRFHHLQRRRLPRGRQRVLVLSWWVRVRVRVGVGVRGRMT